MNGCGSNGLRTIGEKYDKILKRFAGQKVDLKPLFSEE